MNHLSSTQTSKWGRWGTAWDDIWSAGSTLALIGWHWSRSRCGRSSAVAVCRDRWPRPGRGARGAKNRVLAGSLRAKAALTRPRFATGTLRRRLSRSLERNPIGWLQHYSWSGRITKWGWLGCHYSTVESFALVTCEVFADVQPMFVLCSLRGSPSRRPQVSAQERESGALELLLVCPLTVAQLIWGRLRGIWMQYLPSFALLIVCLAFGAEIESYDSRTRPAGFTRSRSPSSSRFRSSGCFFRCTRRTSSPRGSGPWALGIGLPILVVDQQRLILWFFGTANAEAVVFCLQWIVAEVFWLLLYDRLSRRRFLIHA